MERNIDQDFTVALLKALLKEGDALVSRGIAQTSSQVQAWAGESERFVLIEARPLAARVFLVEPDGSQHEYYRETGDQLSERFAELVRSFVTSGMKVLTVAHRREISRRIEQNDLGLGVLIDGGRAAVRGLAFTPSAGLAGSEELFRLVWLDEDES